MNPGNGIFNFEQRITNCSISAIMRQNTIGY